MTPRPHRVQPSTGSSMRTRPVHRSCPSIFVYFTDAAGIQETAIVYGKQAGVLDFARLGNFSFAAVPRRIHGGKGIRTPDLLIANETLYQLSYTPILLTKSHLQSFFGAAIFIDTPICHPV